MGDFAWIAPADLISDIPEKVLSQCGIVAGLLVVAVIWLAMQLAKTRAAWEADRAAMMQIIRSQNTSYDNLAVSHSKLEGILLAVQQRR